MELTEGIKYKMITRAMKPLLFGEFCLKLFLSKVHSQDHFSPLQKKKEREKGLCYDFNSLTEIPRFLSDEECEHIISLAKESGLVMSIAGFDVAAYEGDLDEDMREAGKTALFFLLITKFSMSGLKK